jgi:N-dimethylarginine dimethylaminohydrolase
MKSTYHTEYLKLQSVFIKPVQNAFVSQSHLNDQWKGLNYLEQPDFEASIKEYNSFEKYLKDASIEITYFPKNDSVTIDSIYCRDASIATDFGMILCNMGKAGTNRYGAARYCTFKFRTVLEISFGSGWKYFASTYILP